jgi:hypothetical protein
MRRSNAPIHKEVWAYGVANSAVRQVPGPTALYTTANI